MQKKIYIFGKNSNLSNNLNNYLKNSKLISLEDLIFLKNKKKIKNAKIYLIINKFYPSSKLNRINKLENFYESSILYTAKLLDLIESLNIAKIIYTSSSSVYNSIGDDNYLNNRDLYSSSKLACENMVKNFCKKRNIEFVIARVFNMYGAQDEFSIISKMLKSIKEKKKIFLTNNGQSVRDFIHINDVCKIYKKLILIKGSFTVDIGTGEGTRIIDLARCLSPKLKFVLKNSLNDETENSIADNRFIKNKLRYKNFFSLETFFRKKLNLPIKSLDNSRVKYYKSNNIQKLSDYQKILNFDINYEKILKRKIPNVKINRNKFRKSVVLVTGAGGTIGSNLVHELKNLKPKKIILFDHDETALFNIKRQYLKFNNIVSILGSCNNQNLLKEVISNHRVDTIYHAAAYKHLNILEKNIKVAVENNIFGTLNLINSLNKNVKSLTIISTDKATKPSSVLGMTKRISEIISDVLIKYNNLNVNVSICRFGNVFASQGSFIEVLIDQLKKNQTIYVTSKNAERYFMSIKEACKLVIASSLLKSKKNFFTFDMGQPIRILDLMNKIFEYLELNKKEIKIKFTRLKKGEKLTEEISYYKNYKKTKFEKILSFKEKEYPINEIQNLLFELNKNINNLNQKKHIYLMKKFLRKEL